jgi:hypothetical protein
VYLIEEKSLHTIKILYGIACPKNEKVFLSGGFEAGGVTLGRPTYYY